MVQKIVKGKHIFARKKEMEKHSLRQKQTNRL